MLFGHQNDDTSQTVQPTTTTQDTGVNPLAVDPATGVSLPTAPPPPAPQSLDAEMSSILNQPIASSGGDETTTAPQVDSVMPFPPAPSVQPVTTSDSSVSEPTPYDQAAPMVDNSDESDTVASPANDDLLALKQQALADLSPLVGQLDQTPEEKFRTTMMLIQSTDNPSRIQDAYDAAQAITDEKVRAQALLDIINEINYFTQQKSAA